MQTRKIILAALLLATASLACNMERILNPSLPTATPTLLPGVTPLPTATITPTPIPTPEPGARIASGDQAFFNGDWQRAVTEYTLAYESNTDPEVQAAALLGLGRSYLQMGDTRRSLDNLTTAIANYPTSAKRAELFMALAQTYQALNNYTDAANAYNEYLTLRPGLIDHYAYDWRGDALQAAGLYQEAITNYNLAMQAPHTGDNVHIQLKIGNTFALQGDYTSAITTYQTVIGLTQNDYSKSEALHYIGQAYQAQGDFNSAYLVFQDNVNNYPLSSFAYLSLLELVDAGIPVDEFNRGLINYYIGQPGLAIEAFDRYLAAVPDHTVHNDSVHYYKGLSYQALGQGGPAAAEFQLMIDQHLNDTRWAKAFDELAYTQWVVLKDPEAAIATLESFVDRAPLDPAAPGLLFQAGRIAEISGDLHKAASLWERLSIQFSASEYAFDGFFQAGIIRFRQRDFQGAVGFFQGALGTTSDRAKQAAGYFWLGKSLNALNRYDEAAGAWQQAASLDPTGYYSERARDLLEGRSPFELPVTYSVDVDWEAERQMAELWLRATYAIPDSIDLSGPGPLTSDPRLVRGTELWNLGFYNQARLELEALRVDSAASAEMTYRYMNYAIDLGLYRSGIIAARQVLNLAGMDDAATLTAPRYFNHIRFGLYYDDLVFPAADAYGFHPLFFYSVMRQESLFEGFVTSTAGARGLMQIIPSTGQGIYANSGWPAGYTAEDLYRPVVSVTYGADYLSDQYNYFGQDIHAALAAYNGGPGNSAAWLQLAAGDPDLFVEVIRFSETRLYLRSIYELYTIYRNLYGSLN